MSRHDQVLELLLGLLGDGAYSTDPSALHVRELAAFTDQLVDADTEIAGLLPEVFPTTIVETLERWEELFDLKPADGDTTDQRRMAVEVAYRQRHEGTPAYIEEVVGLLLGYAVTVQEHAHVVYDDPSSIYDVVLYISEGIFKFLVVLPTASADVSDLGRAQRLVDEVKPAHTEGCVVFAPTIHDEPFAISDACLYGA